MISLTGEILILPLALLIVYALPAIVLVIRQGLRRGETIAFALYIVISATWFLSVMPEGLRAIWPDEIWRSVATCALIGMGISFLLATWQFLQKPRFPIASVVPGLLAALSLVTLDQGLIAVPAAWLHFDTFTLTPGLLATHLGASLALLYTVIAFLITGVEYIRRPSPLHRNRIAYWLFGTIILIAGPATIWLFGIDLDLIAAGVHWSGVALITYIIIQPHLPDIASAILHVLSDFLATLIPVFIATGSSVVIIYTLSTTGLFPLGLNSEVFTGVVIGTCIAGIVVFLFYWPLSSLTRRVVERLLFGRGYQAQQVIREHSQAISRVMILDALAATTLEVIRRALGIQQGALLVVNETTDLGWKLLVIRGAADATDQPRLTVRTGTPLEDWLVKRGEPLYQYTLDVDPQFQVLGKSERDAWQQLDMEIYFPIRRSGTFIGLLALGRRRGRSYSTRDLELLETMADQMAVALENAALFDRAQRRAEQLALLNEIGRMITASLDLKPTVDLLTERIGNAFKVASGFIFLRDEESGQLVLHSTVGRAKPEAGDFSIRPGQGIVGHIFLEGEPLLIAEPPLHQHYDPAVDAPLIAEARSALGVPMTIRGKPVGVILLADPNPNRLGTTELSLLDAIAAFASIAIENAWKVAAREDDLRRQVAALLIEIDEARRARMVEQITSTAYFQNLRLRAREFRQERAGRPRRPAKKPAEIAKSPPERETTPPETAQLPIQAEEKRTEVVKPPIGREEPPLVTIQPMAETVEKPVEVTPPPTENEKKLREVTQPPIVALHLSPGEALPAGAGIEHRPPPAPEVEEAAATFRRLEEHLSQRAPVEGITLADVMGLPDPLRSALNKMTHGGPMTLRAFSAELQLPADETRRLGRLLIEKGFLRAIDPGEAADKVAYQIRFARKRGRSMPQALWKAIEDGEDKQ